MLITETRPIDQIKPYEKNPRLNDGAVEAVARSIAKFGWQHAIIVDSQGVIIAGHTRYKAAIKLGMTEVPVRVSDLIPEQAKAFRLADNQTAAIATFDMELLPTEIRELEALDFDLSVLGWSAEELSEILAPPGNPGLTDPDDIPAPPRRGDHAARGPVDLGQPPPALRR